MPNAAGYIFGVAYILAGILFLVVMFIYFHRYRQIRLQVTFLRGLLPMLYALICLSNAFAIFADRSDYAIRWYGVTVMAVIATQGFNILFLTFVIYGRLHGTTGTLVIFFLGVNLFLLFTEENFSVLLTPEFMAFYPVLSPTFFATNIISGLIHTFYDTWANFKVIRRPDISTPTKRKFLLFTGGISIMYLTFAGAILGVLVFKSGTYFFWGVVGCFGGVVLVFFGLFYANPSVFYLPIRLYMLVVFKVGDPGGMIYEKRFDLIQSTSAQLLGPGVASIADLVGNSFQQSKHLSLFSLPGRKLLYEWGDGMGAVLIADQETTVYRNCLRLVLKVASMLRSETEKFDARVTEIFSFYTNERKE